jgi:hypothetical protein
MTERHTDMTTDQSKLSPETRALQRIAAARVNRPRVDHNGRIIDTERTKFLYDADGLLINTEPDDAA